MQIKSPVQASFVVTYVDKITTTATKVLPPVAETCKRLLFFLGMIKCLCEES